MRYLIGAVLLLFLFNACSSKEGGSSLLQRYEKKRSSYKILQKTEKIQLYDNNVTKALLTATYLYEQGLKSDRIKDEKFIVGVYLEEEDSNRLGDAYRLKLDGKEPLKIEPLTKESKYLENVSFVIQWNTYYLVTFPYVPQKSFMLTFESDRYGKGEQRFSKIAKYLLDDPAL
ncbi:MAG: hypothetical protein ABXS92_07740 [Sulfurimonas sp.]